MSNCYSPSLDWRHSAYNINICCRILIITKINTCLNWLNTSFLPLSLAPLPIWSLLLQALAFPPGILWHHLSILCKQGPFQITAIYFSFIYYSPFDICYTFLLLRQRWDKKCCKVEFELRCVGIRLPKAALSLGQMHSCCDRTSDNKSKTAQQHLINHPDNNMNHKASQTRNCQIWRLHIFLSFQGSLAEL